jgi:hypothetical protein
MKPISLNLFGSESREGAYIKIPVKTRNSGNNKPELPHTYTNYQINKTGSLPLVEAKREEVQIKKSIKFLQLKKKEELSNFHKNSLLESFRLSTNYSTIQTNENTVFKTETDIFQNTNNKKIDKNFFYEGFRVNNSKNTVSLTKSFEGLSDYLHKSHSLRRMNYCLNLQAENVLRFDEEIKNGIEENKEKVSTFAKNYAFFEKFLVELGKYVMYLQNTRETQTIILGKLKEDKNILQREITRLSHKKEKADQELNTLSEYKLFLKCLKERRDFDPVKEKMNELALKAKEKINSISVGVQNRNKSLQNISNENISKKGTGLRSEIKKKFTNLFKIKKDTLLFNNKFSVISSPGESENIFSKIFCTVDNEQAGSKKEKDNFIKISEQAKIKEKEEMIYGTPDEALADLKDLQNRVLGLIRLYDKNEEIIKSHSIKISVNSHENLKNSQNVELESQLKELKDRNKYLINEKTKYSKKKDNNECELLFKKVEELYDFLDSTNYFNFPIHLNALKFKKEINKNDRTEFIIPILRNIEDSINHVWSQYEKLSKGEATSKRFSELEKKMDKERKIKLIEMNEKNFQQSNLEIMKKLDEKHHRLIVKGRKYANRVKKKGIEENGIKNFSLTTKNFNTDFAEMIDY